MTPFWSQQHPARDARQGVHGLSFDVGWRQHSQDVVGLQCTSRYYR